MLRKRTGEKTTRSLRKELLSEGGWTLIELSIAVLVIAILVAIAVPVMLGDRGKADRVTAEYNLKAGGSCVNNVWFNIVSRGPSADGVDSYRDHSPPTAFTASSAFLGNGFVPVDAWYMSYYETRIPWADLEVGAASPPIAAAGYLPSVLAETSYGFQIKGIYRNGAPVREGPEIAADWGLLPGKICVVQSQYYWDDGWRENSNNFYITLITLEHSGTAHYLTMRKGSLAASGAFDWDDGNGAPGDESGGEVQGDDSVEPDNPPPPVDPADDPPPPSEDDPVVPGDDTPVEEPVVPPEDPPEEPADNPPAEPEEPPELVSELKVEPDTINLGANGTISIFITIVFANGYTVDDIDPSSLKCYEATPDRFNTTGNDTLIVKFDREDLLGVPLGDEVLFEVTGKFTDGTPWQGFDIVRVIN